MRAHDFSRFAVAAALGVTLAAAPMIPAAAQAPPVELETRMVQMDGHVMRVKTSGLDSREPGEPVVVFETGAFTPIEGWGELPARVAAFAPVVAYDRSTIGQSEWDGEVGTPAHVTAKLWTLLHTLGAEPPYVLVGWSWGGDLVRYHAGSHPADIAGLVHVDPAGHSPAARLSVFQAVGFGEEEYTADVEAMEGFLPRFSPARQADVKAVNQLYADRREPEYGPVPSVPTAVLVSGRYRPQAPEEVEVPYDRRAHFEATLRSKVHRLSEWALATPEGLFVLVRNSGHAIHRDAPELVVHAIRRAVFPDPARRLQQMIEQDGISVLLGAYEALKDRYPTDQFDEHVLNRLGHDLLRNGRVDEAIAVFELNVREYPDAWRPRDSLGDAYRAAGETERAIESYRKSLDLNPASPSARKLDELQK